MHVKGIIYVTNTAAQDTAPKIRNKKVTFKNFPPFFNCIKRINNTQVNDANDIDVVMPLYNLIEYRNNYSKISGSLWQSYRDEPALDNNNVIIDFLADSNNNCNLFKFKLKIKGQANNNGVKDVEIWFH